jgi:hypothetical protein
MPPEEHSRVPSDKEISELKAWYSQVREKAADPSRAAPMRRLNRREYENTIRDLFGLGNHAFDNPQQLVLNDQYFQPAGRRMPDYVMIFSQFQWGHRNPPRFPGVPLLPDDPPVEHGFDTDATSLSFSPLQLERYFEFADKLLDHPEFPRAAASWEALFESNKLARKDLLHDASGKLAWFLPRAFRREPTAAELKRWLARFEQQLEKHENFREAMKATVLAVLVSPQFLFRSEAAERPDGYDNYEIACRLSYFLWSSMPDDQLLQAARDGRLQDPGQVRLQVQRMLDDRRTRSLSTGFASQWLKTRQAISARPDRHRFPHYYHELGQSPPGVSMALEQMLLFETVLVENRSILDFINAPYAYLNRLLMDWYDIDPQSAVGFSPGRHDLEDFFRIRWPDDRRGGVVASGATLLATSTTTRTSPVFRGAWVLDVLLNRPPPPPPADAPSLAPLVSTADTPADMRQRLEIHRQNPACAVCHDKMDPVGFALEEFDTVGQFRQALPNGTPVDCRGEWQGLTVHGIRGLKQALLDDQQRFIRGFVEHLMEYALGRPLQISDEPAVAAIVNQMRSRNYRLRSVIEAVAVHMVFPESTQADAAPRRIVSQGLRRH